MRYELLQADCRRVLANMGDNTVDSVVCDPPYHLTSIVKRFGLVDRENGVGTNEARARSGADGYGRLSRGFMGQTWDGGDIAFDPTLWAEVLRVLKPGGHLLAFSGTRTYHRMAVAIEDAGFEIRDMFSWLYGSGFPKSHDVSKAIDKAAGAERAIVGRAVYGDGHVQNSSESIGCGGSYPENDARALTAPATDDAKRWDGWGTAVKPAQEPICMARKPLQAGSVAANVLEWGTGAINIDGCRIAGNVPRTTQGGKDGHGFDIGSSDGSRHTEFEPHRAGRFPANVLHDGSDEVVAIFPAEAGAATRVNGDEPSAVTNGIYAERERVPGAFHNDSGSAARFFYCAKASKRDREEGCEHLPRQAAGVVGNDGKPAHRKDEGYEVAKRANHHPTVKPTDLMRYLCRLVTPPGGLVFDPFTGSGSTGKAALLEGFRFIGAEMTAEYIPIARARLEWAAKQRA